MNTKMLSPDHSHASRQPNHAMSAVSTTGKASTPAGGPTWNQVMAAARRRTNHLIAMASRTTGLASAMPPAPTMPYQKTKSKGVFAHFTMMKDSAMSTAPSGMMTARGPSVVRQRAKHRADYSAGHHPQRQRAKDDGGAPPKFVLHGPEEYACREGGAAHGVEALHRRECDLPPTEEDARGSRGRRGSHGPPRVVSRRIPARV